MAGSRAFAAAPPAVQELLKSGGFPSPPKGDAAEAKGKEGTVSAMGVERSLSDAATEQKTTEDALCKQMDALLKQLAAQMPS